MTEQGIRYAVTPMCSVQLPSGRWVREGEAIAVQDFAGSNVPALTLLNRTLTEGKVLEAALPPEPEGPVAA